VRKSKGIEWSKGQLDRDDWSRAWKWIGPLFGDCDPARVTPEQIFGDARRPEIVGLRPLVVRLVSESEAYRVIKVWRALWKKMASFPDFEIIKDSDPSLASPDWTPIDTQKLSPDGLQAWYEDESTRRANRF
jgi:hypothetical protein